MISPDLSTIRGMSVSEWRKAWLEIAIAFETPCRQKTNKQTEVGFCGLCFAFEVQTGCGDLYKLDIPPLGPDAGGEVDLWRATCAALIAAMTPEEFIGMCGPVDPVAQLWR